MALLILRYISGASSLGCPLESLWKCLKLQMPWPHLNESICLSMVNKKEIPGYQYLFTLQIIPMGIQSGTTGLSSAVLTIIFTGFTQPPLSTSPPLAFLPIHCGPGNKAEIFQWRKAQKGRRSRDHLWQVIREKKMRTVEGGRGKWGVKGKVWDSSWKQFSNS